MNYATNQEMHTVGVKMLAHKKLMRTIPPMIVMILLVPLVFSLDECKGVMTTEDIPCLVFLPVTNGCGPIELEFFRDTTFLETRDMGTFTPFLCNTTFNFTTLGTYSFNYSTGDTGTIILEEDRMLNIFQLLVYTFLTALAITLLVLMHKFRDEQGTPVVYGAFAATIFVIQGAMLASGFQLVRTGNFFFPIDVSLAAFMFIMGLFAALASVNTFRQARVPKIEGLF